MVKLIYIHMIKERVEWVGRGVLTLGLFHDSLHRIALKLGGQLHHEVAQRILFRDYGTQNFDRVISFLFFFFF